MVDAMKWGLRPKQYEAVLQRANALQPWAQQNGLTYYWEDPYGLMRYPFAFFNLTFKLRTFNVLAGQWQGTELYAFEYQGNDHGMGSDKWEDFPTFRTLVMVPIPGSLPATLYAGKKTRWMPWRMPGRLGYQGFSSGDPAFDDVFKSFSVHPAFGQWALNPSMKEWLLSRGENFGLEFNQQNMLLISHQIPIEELRVLLDFAAGLKNVFPPETWQTYPAPAQG